VSLRVCQCQLGLAHPTQAVYDCRLASPMVLKLFVDDVQLLAPADSDPRARPRAR
jgi:hypothetical protein